MPIKRIIESLPPTGTKKDMPVVFHEPHVESGFRPIHQPWYYYLLSLFQKQNECMNSWTHLVGGIIAMGQIYKIMYEFDAINDPWMYPMMAGSITMLMMYTCSTMAHTFHNKSEQLHYTCFSIDYAGIGVYGLGSTIIHLYYCTDVSLMGSTYHHYGVWVAVVLAVNVCIFCSHSKVKYSRPYPFTRKVWQLSGIVMVYVWLIIPIMHRILLFMQHPINNVWDESLSHHSSQVMWFMAAGFFFGSDIPQRFFPGRCDFLFHGHQIFHVCIMFTNLKQIDGMYYDIKHRLEEIKSHQEVPTFWNTFGAVLIVLVANACVVTFFHHKAKKRIEKEALERHECKVK